MNSFKSILIHKLSNITLTKGAFIPLGTIHEADLVLRELGYKSHDIESDPLYEDNLNDLFNGIPKSVYKMKDSNLLTIRGKTGMSGISLELTTRKHFEEMYESWIKWNEVLNKLRS